MKNEVARFMVSEIRKALTLRKRPLDAVLTYKLNFVFARVDADVALTDSDAEFLEKNYTRFTDPSRLKWGSHVRI